MKAKEAAVLAVMMSGSLATTMTTVARADEEHGASVGLRAGYAIPLGSAHEGQSLASLEGGMLPVWFDVGYRFTREIYVGAFFQYGITAPPSGACPSGSCSGSDMRFGVDAHYHLRPRALLDPWVGLGVGYEVARVTSTSGAGADETTLSMSGLQFVDLQLGGDFRFAPTVPFGPFVDLSVGRYSSFTTTTATQSISLAPGETFHEWLTLGLRGQFDL